MIVFKWFLLRMLFGWIVRSWTVTCLGPGWFGRMLLRKLWLMLTGWLVDLSIRLGRGHAQFPVVRLGGPEMRSARSSI